MKHIIFCLIILLVKFSFSQSLYTPNSTLFLAALNGSYNTVSFNLAGTYNYDYSGIPVNPGSTHSIDILFENTGSNLISFNLENLNLSNFDQIDFYIRSKTKLVIKNCIFNFKSAQGIRIFFTSDIYPNDSEVTFDSCKFYNDCSGSTTGNAMMLFAKDPEFNTGNFILKNVNIKSCEFQPSNYSSLNSLSAIRFSREIEAVSFSDITFFKNKFYFNDINNCNTVGIYFDNTGSHITSSAVPSTNITIDLNEFNTDSQNPGQAIQIHGPCVNIDVIKNEINNFGASFIYGSDLSNDGAIHIYGARNGKDYSDNNSDITIYKNIIYTRSSGIRLTGHNEAVVNENTITMLDLTNYMKTTYSGTLKVDRPAISSRTGNAADASKKSYDIKIYDNIIYCNSIQNTLGILLEPCEDIHIYDNKIYSPGNYGIAFYSNTQYVDQDFGNLSEIYNNTVDYENQTINDLSSDYLLGSNGKFAAINIARHTNTHYYNERLQIKNNIIIKKDKNIDDIVILPDQNNNVNYEIQNNHNPSVKYDIVGRYHRFCKPWYGSSTGFNPGTTNFNTWTMSSPLPDGIIAGDFNGDGRDDILAWADLNCETWYGEENGVFSNSNPSSYDFTFWSGSNLPEDVVVGDFNGDGYEDVLARYHRFCKPWYGSSSGDFSPGTSYFNTWTMSSPYPNGIIAGDFNGDGRDDILAWTGLNCETWFGEENGVFTNSDPSSYDFTFWSGSNLPEDIVVGDFNGDGYDDVLARYHRFCKPWYGSSSGDFSPGTSYFNTWTMSSPYPDGIIAGDFNGDGKDDILAWAGLNCETWYGEENGVFSNSNPSSYDFAFWSGSNLPEEVESKDFNGDGCDDILARYNTFCRVWYGQTTEVFNSPYSFYLWSTSEYPDQIVSGNFNETVEYFPKLQSGSELDEKKNQIDYQLINIYPNPFNLSTNITIKLKKETYIQLYVYNVLGEKIETLMNEQKTNGTYAINWDAKLFTSGVYFIHLKAGTLTEVRKCLLIK